MKGCGHTGQGVGGGGRVYLLYLLYFIYLFYLRYLGSRRSRKSRKSRRTRSWWRQPWSRPLQLRLWRKVVDEAFKPMDVVSKRVGVTFKLVVATDVVNASY